MVNDGVGALSETVSGIGGALSSSLSYYAGSFWGSGVAAEEEKPKPEKAVDEKSDIETKIAKLYQGVDESKFSEVRNQMREP